MKHNCNKDGRASRTETHTSAYCFPTGVTWAGSRRRGGGLWLAYNHIFEKQYITRNNNCNSPVIIIKYRLPKRLPLVLDCKGGRCECGRLLVCGEVSKAPAVFFSCCHVKLLPKASSKCNKRILYIFFSPKLVIGSNFFSVLRLTD